MNFSWLGSLKVLSAVVLCCLALGRQALIVCVISKKPLSRLSIKLMISACLGISIQFVASVMSLVKLRQFLASLKSLEKSRMKAA